MCNAHYKVVPRGTNYRDCGFNKTVRSKKNHPHDNAQRQPLTKPVYLVTQILGSNESTRVHGGNKDHTAGDQVPDTV